VAHALGERKVWIPTPDALRVMGYDWSQVRVVPDGTLQGYPRFNLPCSSPTPGSLVFPPSRVNHLPLTGVATAVPMASQGKEIQLVGLYGWLRGVDNGCGDGSDFHYLVELDIDWALSRGIDLHQILRVGNIVINGIPLPGISPRKARLGWRPWTGESFHRSRSRPVRSPSPAVAFLRRRGLSGVGMHSGSSDRAGRLARGARSQGELRYLAAAVVFLVAILLVGHKLEQYVKPLEAWIAELGPWGGVTFVATLVLGTSILLPESIFGVSAGVLFGLFWGLVASLVGNLLAASLQYALARWLLRARVRRSLAARPSLAAFQDAVLEDEIRLQFLVRLTPVNPATVSYLLGAAGVRFRGFLLACLALLPHLLLEVFLGHAGEHVARMAAGAGSETAHSLAILGGVLAVTAVVVLVSRMAHKAVTAAVAAADHGRPEEGSEEKTG